MIHLHPKEHSSPAPICNMSGCVVLTSRKGRRLAEVPCVSGVGGEPFHENQKQKEPPSLKILLHENHIQKELLRSGMLI